MSTLSLEACTSNLKFVVLTILELLAFNAQTGLIDQSAAHTDRHTSNENSIPTIHFVHLVEIIKVRLQLQLQSCTLQRIVLRGIGVLHTTQYLCFFVNEDDDENFR